MGLRGYGLKQNDAFLDIYDAFFEHYNNGKKPEQITEIILSEYSEFLEVDDDKHNFWYAIALAQWETKSLTKKILEEVEEIINSGKDLEVLKDLGATEKDLKKRQTNLLKFLEKIKQEKEKPKARKRKKKPVEPIFGVGDCLTFKLYNGNYGGGEVLGSDSGSGFSYNLVAITRINSPHIPILDDFKKSEVLIANFPNWKNQEFVNRISTLNYEKEYDDLFSIVGKLKVKKKYRSSERNYKYFNSMYSGDWMFMETANKQFKYEEENPKPSKKIKIKKLLGSISRW